MPFLAASGVHALYFSGICQGLGNFSHVLLLAANVDMAQLYSRSLFFFGDSGEPRPVEKKWRALSEADTLSLAGTVLLLKGAFSKGQHLS